MRIRLICQVVKKHVTVADVVRLADDVQTGPVHAAFCVSIFFVGLSLFITLLGPDDVTARVEAEGDQPSALQLCGRTSGDQGEKVHNE